MNVVKNTLMDPSSHRDEGEIVADPTWTQFLLV